MELVYDYLTGPRFRHRVEAIVEKFSDQQADLDREKKSMTRLWQNVTLKYKVSLNRPSESMVIYRALRVVRFRKMSE